MVTAASSAAHLSVAQTLIAVVALVGATASAWHGDISGDALVALYGMVAGGALGYVNGVKSGRASV